MTIDLNHNLPLLFFLMKLIILNLIKNPIPNHEAEHYTNFNFMRKDALG